MINSSTREVVQLAETRDILLAHYVHNLDPIAFYLDGVGVAWYWLVYLAGFFFVFYGGLQVIKTRSHSLIRESDFADYMAFGWLGLITGSRVWYVLFYNFEYFSKHPAEILRIWNGGMSFHGALVGVALSFFAVSRVKKQPFWPVCDLVALLTPFVLMFGRITNFINGELAGRVTDVKWGVIFPRYIDNLPRHPSQLYQAFSEGLLLFVLLATQRKRLNRPGQMSGLFLVGYGGFRFLTEFFRMPDPQIGYLAMGLTVGQLYCLVMVIVGGLIFKRHLLSPDLASDEGSTHKA